jgi:proline iminopeptidase
VPPTAELDPSLPQVSVELAGQPVALHLETAGSSGAPVVIVLHGGPGGDYRMLLPLRALADRFFVVLYDQQGGGLSQRVDESRLTLDSLDAALDQVGELHSPDRTFALIGHSFGAQLAARYAARHPGRVSALVLLEPGGLTPQAFMAEPSVLWGIPAAGIEGFLWSTAVLSSGDHARADYRIAMAARTAADDYGCPGDAPQAYPFWRFGAYAMDVLTRDLGDIDWTQGLAEAPVRALLVAGACGELGADFQQVHNLPALPGARFEVIEQAGHVSMLQQRAADTLQAIASFLGEP